MKTVDQDRSVIEHSAIDGSGIKLQKPPKPDQCELCERKIGLTFHHLIPRKVHSRARFKKHYTRVELNQGVWLCRDCHRAVHRFHDELALAQQFNSLEKLKACEIIERHLAWQRKQRRKV